MRFAYYGNDETLNAGGPVPANAVPTYAVSALAAFMPRRKGACVHITPVDESIGEVETPIAVICVEREAVNLRDGTKAATWRIDWVERGGSVRATYWIDEKGHPVRESYGGPTADRADRADRDRGA